MCLLWSDHPEHYKNLFNEQHLIKPENLVNREYFESGKSYATKANALRLEIVRDFGGIYLDVDFVCHRSIESTIESLDFFVANQDEQFINNAVFGATPFHSQVEIAIGSLSRISRESDHCAEIASGPHLFTSLYRDVPGVTVLPSTLFYPMSYAGEYERVDANSIGTHLWAHTWGN
jgi:mannosyltransferase OCH1-like enzyme